MRRAQQSPLVFLLRKPQKLSVLCVPCDVHCRNCSLKNMARICVDQNPVQDFEIKKLRNKAQAFAYYSLQLPAPSDGTFVQASMRHLELICS